METKQCWSCGETKPTSEFWRRQANPDGLDNYCATCKTQHRREQAQTPQGLYEAKSRIITTYNRPRWFPLIPPDHQIDHKFSIRKGYMRSVPLTIINNRNNLQLLTTYQNRRKGSKCSISISELYDSSQNDRNHTRICELLQPITDLDRLEEIRQKIIKRNDAE